MSLSEHSLLQVSNTSAMNEWCLEVGNIVLKVLYNATIWWDGGIGKAI